MKKGIFLLLIPIIASSKIEDKRDKLFKIKTEIEKIEKSLHRARDKKEKTQDKIKEIATTKEKHKKALTQTENDIKKISERIERTEEKIENLKKQINSKKNGLSFAVKELWFSHTPPLFFKQSQEKENCLNILIDELCLSIEGREREKKKETMKKEVFGDFLVKTQKEKEKIVFNIKRADGEISLQKRALQEIKKDEEALQKRIAKLKQDQKRLEVLITKVERERKKLPKKPSKPVGSLIWPTKSRNIVREFGRYTHPETGAILINKGIDISAPLGSPVFAVADGEVVYADWFRGYGNLVMINHDGSLYSLYANLLEMNVGIKDRVTKGQIIGSVGKSKETESPILHFEIRLDGEAEDPMDWLG